MWRSRWPTTARASPPRCCRICSAGMSAAPAARRATAWGSRSARGWSRRTGGRIRAASDGPGEGTTITFTIPAAAEPGVARGAAAGRGPDAGTEERPRILVVDDDPHTLRFVRDTLTKEGYAPLVTGAPDDLAGLIRAERPELVLLDLMLPGSDGIELLEEVPELSDLPVIFISGYGRDETIARAFELGADDYIVKPFSPTELVARIRAVLRRHRDPETFVLGALAIAYEERRVTVGGAEVDLTAHGVRSAAPALGQRRAGGCITTRSCAASGTGAKGRMRTWSGSSCGRSAPSSATTRRTRPGSSTGAASATACRDPASAEPPPVGAPGWRMPPAGEDAGRKTASPARRLERTGRGRKTASGVSRGPADSLRADPVSRGGRPAGLGVAGRPRLRGPCDDTVKGQWRGFRIGHAARRDSCVSTVPRAPGAGLAPAATRAAAGMSVRATHTTSPMVSASAGHGSASTAGLSLASSHSPPGPRGALDDDAAVGAHHVDRALAPRPAVAVEQDGAAVRQGRLHGVAAHADDGAAGWRPGRDGPARRRANHASPRTDSPVDVGAAAGRRGELHDVDRGGFRAAPRGWRPGRRACRPGGRAGTGLPRPRRRR